MNRVSIRVLYIGAEPTLQGKTGWAHRAAHEAPEAPWTFEADDGTRVVCTTRDVTVWLGGDALELATKLLEARLAAKHAPNSQFETLYHFRKWIADQRRDAPACAHYTPGAGSHPPRP